MAERVPFFTLFESFQAPRQLRLLLHDACIISGALDMAGRTLEAQIESSETLPQAAQDALQQMLAQQYDLRQVLLHFCGTGEQKGDNGVIWGKTITGKLTPIGELNIKQGSAIVEGRVFKTECYETRRKGMWTLNFNITDERGSVAVRKAMDEKEAKVLGGAINDGMWLRLQGKVELTYDGKDILLRPVNIMKISHTARQDNAPEKRVELHLHTQMSSMDALTDVGKVVKQAAAWGHPAIAITDHGNMFGVKEFYDAANAAGLKPILGCEVYVVKNHREKDKDEKAGDHLILLAKNLKGYHNLVKLVSYSWTEGFYYKPRIDKELLRQYHEGLICSSACLGGELPQAIMHDDLEEASRIVEEFKEIFGEDYYLELQLHRSLSGAPDTDTCRHQVEVNKVLHDLAARHGVKLIVTNDVHFTLEEDAPAHDHLICLNTGRDLDDPNRMRYTGQEFFKSPDEMAALFPDDLEALENTMEIADKVEHYTLEHKPLMPDFPLPDDFVIDQAELRRIFLRRFDGQISGL